MNVSQSAKISLSNFYSLLKTRKEMLYIIFFTLALVAFEAFNYSTTDFALSDLLGDLSFLGFRWATLLSIAFCGIDFAGIALLLAPQSENGENRSAWFMFGAWFLAATMNAILTWWGVALAVGSHPVVSAGVVNESFVLRTVPVFIAMMVWVIRIMIVGSFSKKANRLTAKAGQSGGPAISRRELRQAQSRAAHPAANQRSVPSGVNSTVFAQPLNAKRGYRPEPTYIPMQDEAVFHALKSPGTGQRRA
ncbi:MAG TPA: hypothetical protein PLR56_06120 [Brevefilum sp.]|nr:hypothetical protein [Brevefilum sp.]